MTALIVVLIVATTAGVVWDAAVGVAARRMRAAGRGLCSEAYYLALDEVGL